MRALMVAICSVLGLGALAALAILVLETPSHNSGNSAMVPAPPVRARIDPSRTMTDGGPIAFGLQLRFSIADDGTSSSSVHRCQLEIINVSDQIQTLTAPAVVRESDDTDLADALSDFVGFEVYPDARRFTYQYGMTSHRTRVRPYYLKPGASLIVSWECKNSQLIWQPGQSGPSWGFNLASNGLYFARAVVELSTTDHRAIRLWSNEQRLVVGGSLERPIPPESAIFNPNDTERTVAISAGSSDGVAVGDRYAVYRGIAPTWNLEVIDVGPTTSVLRVTPGDDAYPNTTFPGEIEKAVRLRPRSDGNN